MTSLELRVNVGDPDIAYGETGADYMLLDLIYDYLIWTAGDTIVKDNMTHEPTPTELTNASPIIDPDVDVIVPLCLLMDYSFDDPAGVYTHKVQGMSENKKFVFCFSFDGATATEPQLEAWDDDTMLTTDNEVLGAGTPANSMVCAICTTTDLPSSNWVGTAIAGSGLTRVVKLNDGDGALPELETGETSQELYANIKIVIPANHSTPAIETFSLVVRYSFI